MGKENFGYIRDIKEEDGKIKVLTSKYLLTISSGKEVSIDKVHDILFQRLLDTFNENKYIGLYGILYMNIKGLSANQYANLLDSRESRIFIRDLLFNSIPPKEGLHIMAENISLLIYDYKEDRYLGSIFLSTKKESVNYVLKLEFL